MALKLEVESMDEIPENLRDLYVEKGGKFVLDVDGLPDIGGLTRKRDELLRETKAEREKRQALESALAEREEADALKNKEFEKLAEQYKKAGTETAEKLAALQKKVADSARASLAKQVAGLLTKDMQRATLLEKEAIALIEFENDQAQVSGGLTVEQLAEQLKKQYPFLADGNPASGGGASGGGVSGGATKKFSEYSGQELTQIRKQDPALYERLKADHYR
jgi:hypothetical protein